MQERCRLTVLTVLSSFFVQSLAGHHSFSAEFDIKKPIAITGEVTKVEWSNPHVYLYVSVKRDGNKPVLFAVENASPNVLRRLRWGKDSVRAGDTVTVEGYLAKNGSDTVNAITLRMADGTTLYTGSSYYDGLKGPNKK